MDSTAQPCGSLILYVQDCCQNCKFLQGLTSGPTSVVYNETDSKHYVLMSNGCHGDGSLGFMNYTLKTRCSAWAGVSLGRSVWKSSNADEIKLGWSHISIERLSFAYLWPFLANAWNLLPVIVYRCLFSKIVWNSTFILLWCKKKYLKILIVLNRTGWWRYHPMIFWFQSSLIQRQIEFPRLSLTAERF